MFSPINVVRGEPVEPGKTPSTSSGRTIYGFSSVPMAHYFWSSIRRSPMMSSIFPSSTWHWCKGISFLILTEEGCTK